MTITNPLISAATFLLREAETFASPYEFSKLLDAAAPDSGLARAWACSAVLLKNGEWKLVPSHDYVRVVGGSLQLKVFGGGTLAGRGYWHSSEWLETEVDKVWLGALVLPGGEGVAATFESASGRRQVKVVPADSPTADGSWPTSLLRANADPKVLSLKEALAEAGAVAVSREGAARAEELPEMMSLADTWLPAGDQHASARALAKNMFKIGAIEVDQVSGAIKSDELAQILSAAGDAGEGAARAAAALLMDAVAGPTARAGVAHRLSEAWAASSATRN